MAVMPGILGVRQTMRSAARANARMPRRWNCRRRKIEIVRPRPPQVIFAVQ
jgi:hypothetical protein